MSNISFCAQITRNFDGVCSENSQKVIAGYDKEIQKLIKKRDEASELDTFMNSKEVKQLTKQLPKKDIVDIQQSVYNDKIEDCFTGVQYVVRDDKSWDKLFKTTIHPEKRDDLAFQQVRKDDGTLNKEGILGWLNHLVEFFGNK